MKILVTGRSMSYLSGQPLYCFELARELKRQGHDVTVLSEWDAGVVNGLTGKDGHYLKEIIDEENIKRLSWNDIPKDEYDLCLASENMSLSVIQKIPNTPVINIIHSEYDYETPIENSPQIIAYVCIRYSILRHIVDFHNIPEDKCHIIYNGIDRERFKKKPKEKRDYKKIVVPCTLDTMREPFLNHLIDSANDKKRVFIFGMDCGAKLHESLYATINPDKFHIEEDIADADEVAGILLGRVNLEAWSCGVPSRVYDPDTLENKLFEVPADFDKNHNIKNVVKDIIKLSGNLDDITVLIPHHTARQKLATMLESIKTIKNVVIVKGGSFARNVNNAFKTVETNYILIANDDITFNPQLLLRAMMSSGFDICGAMPDNGCKGFQIIDGKLIESETPNYPSGALLLIKIDVFKKLNGFNEKFINGGEDIDLYLRAEEKGYKVGLIGSTYHHDCASSEGRYNHLTDNIKLFNSLWKNCQIPL